jgi:hypothetical protein
MRSSSTTNSNNNSSHEWVNALFQLHSHCVQYQSYLIELILQDSKNTFNISEDVYAIIEALKHERDLAGNLAGKLNVELIAGTWCIGETAFLDKLTSVDIDIITQKLNSIPGKASFSEADIRNILQDLLINKCDPWLMMNDQHYMQVVPNHIKQYQFINNIRKQLNGLLHSVEKKEVLSSQQLYKFSILLEVSTHLFPESTKISIFAPTSALPPELKEIIHESQELLDSQKQRLGINYRTP